MFVNKIPFLVTISRHLKFGTIKMLPSRSKNYILSAIKMILPIYNTSGFKVDSMLMDNEFECLRSDLGGLKVNLNISAADKHVPDIEQYIQTVKEHVQSMYNGIQYKTLPNQLLVELVYCVLFWLNNFLLVMVNHRHYHPDHSDWHEN